MTGTLLIYALCVAIGLFAGVVLTLCLLPKGQAMQPKARTVARERTGRRAKFKFEIECDEDGADY